MQYPDFLFPGKTQKEAGQVEAPSGIRIYETMNSINPISWRKTAQQIIQLKPDFVVVRFWLPFMAPCLGTICKWVKQATGVPIIGILDNVVPHEKRIGDRPLTNYFLSHCDAFVTMSSSVEKELLQFDRVKPRKLLYHPVYDHFGEKVQKQEARKHLNIPHNRKVLLFFGIIRKYKGLSLLLEALSLVEDRADLQLFVAGEFYDDRSEYETLIDEFGLRENVTIHAGFVQKQDVKYYFCAADLVAQPYLSATQSGVTQIAYHFEIPMLVTDVGGLPEMVPHNSVGFVCERKPDAIAKSIEEFFSSYKIEEFQKNIKEEKKRFEWDFFAGQILEMAKTML